jgi:hypothetical protein
MSNEVNNLAASFVAMAQAFEELPKVRQELEAKSHDFDTAQDMIQNLQLRIMDYKNQLDEANARTRKAEVERDHAETMFLETDSKLDAAKGVLNALMGNASDFLRAVEPPKPEPEPVIETTPEPKHDMFPEPEYYQKAESAPTPTDASSTASSFNSLLAAPDASAASGESVASSTMGESASSPISATAQATSSTSDAMTATSSAHLSDAPEVASPSDPTQGTVSSSESGLNVSTDSVPSLRPYAGKRYTDVPFYVSLVEWLNGGGTEEAYYAK